LFYNILFKNTTGH